VEDHHTPIISRETYRLTQEIRRLRKENVYPYQGFLVCPNCGRKLVKMMRGWGCTCKRCYIPADRLNAAMLKAYEEFDPTDTADEQSQLVKAQKPTMDSVEYWWLKELVDRITFDTDGRTLTVCWICEKKTEVSTGYKRMWADIKYNDLREQRAKEELNVKREKTVTKVEAKKVPTNTTVKATTIPTAAVERKVAGYSQGEM